MSLLECPFEDAKPSTLPIEQAPRRIYLSAKDDSKFVVVDAEDYEWLSRWKWTFRLNSTGKKVYAVRNGWINGARTMFYMHVEIMKRTGIVQPSPLSHMTDHRDGDSCNNRRSNLRWATPRANAKNRRKK